MPIPRCSVALLAAVGIGGCFDNPTAAPDALDYSFYRCRVEPVLIAGCATYACHGSTERPYRIYAPNRLRLGVLPSYPTPPPLSELESRSNFEAASAFMGPSPGYDDPLLVAKPMDRSIGGAYHEGAELYGGVDVFTDPADPGLGVLRAWATGAAEEPSCEP